MGGEAKINRAQCLFSILALLILAACMAARSSDGPAVNPYLSAGAPAVTHSDPSASDMQIVAGPTEIGTIEKSRIKRLPAGIITINYAGLLSYPGGVKATWNANNNRVAKIRIDDDHWKELAVLPIEGMSYMPPNAADNHLSNFDSANDIEALKDYVGGALPYYAETQAREAGIYTLTDDRGEFYVLSRNELLVYAETDSNDPFSPIKLVRRWSIPAAFKRDKQTADLLKSRMDALGFKLPPEMEKALSNFRDVPLGINMTYDGHIAFSMVGGTVIILDRDFKTPAQHFIIENEILANSLSLDEDGGIYVVGDRNMHKLRWTGGSLSSKASDGAWSSAYPFTLVPLPGVRGGGTGAGTTPTLMGFGDDEDRLVVIADGQNRMNLVAFWRDDIPSGKTDRIAGMIASDMGGVDDTYIQTEVSIPVSGYKAFLVNGMAPENIKPDLENLLAQGPYLAPPRGIEMFEWDTKADKWRSLWARADVSSPAAVIPLISHGSQQAYTMTWDDAGWAISGFDLESGEQKTRMTLGPSQAYNGAWGQLQLLPDGDVFIPGLAGPVRVLANKP